MLWLLGVLVLFFFVWSLYSFIMWRGFFAGLIDLTEPEEPDA